MTIFLPSYLTADSILKMEDAGSYETFVPVYTVIERWREQIGLVVLPIEVWGRVIAGSLGKLACVSVLPVARS